MSGRDYTCATFIGLYQSDPDGHCSPSLSNCQTIAYRYNGDRVDEFFFGGFAPIRPACDDTLDNDGDGTVDIADPDCNYLASGMSEGLPPAICSNRRDDDGDGKTDLQDPGCRGKGGGTSEADPAAVRSIFRLTSVKATRRCRLDIEIEALPDLKPAKLFPFGKVDLRVRGIGGRGKGYIKKRLLPVSEAPGYSFKLKPGRYRVTGRYLGDRYRLASKTRTRTTSVCAQKRRG